MNETIINDSIVKSSVNFLTTTIKTGTSKVTDFINLNISQTWMANIILLIIACAVIFIGSKITQKFAKFGLYILGIILIIGIGMNFIT